MCISVVGSQILAVEIGEKSIIQMSSRDHLLKNTLSVVVIVVVVVYRLHHQSILNNHGSFNP